MSTYVGVSRITGKMKIFNYNGQPSIQTHGDLYKNIIGPFKSSIGAYYWANYSTGNPECVTIKDAEQLGHVYAMTMATKAMNAIGKDGKPALRFKVNGTNIYFCPKCRRKLKYQNRDKHRGTMRQCTNSNCGLVYYERVWCRSCRRWTITLLGSANDVRCLNCTMVI